MVGNADKPNDFSNDVCLWFISILFFINRNNVKFIIYCLLFFPISTLGQCPGNNFFIDKISFIYNSSTKKVESQVKELLELQQQMEACNLEKDSSFMFVLQKIGALYSRQSNFSVAINFTKESIRIAKECINKNSCNTEPLVDNYYNLFYYYSKLGQLEKKYDAIDSCIAYVLKGSNGFNKGIAVLTDKTDYLFNKGEYNLCNENASLGEHIIQKYYHGKDSIQYIVFFVMKQANAMYFSKNISSAEKVLESKISQFIQTGNSNQLYAFYSLLGLICTDKKNYTEALTFFQKAYHTSSIIKFREGCNENLQRIGMLYAKYFNNHDKGLMYCTKALSYADGTDSLLVLRQIANIYVLKKMYDSSQYFFQLAYNTVQRGMNETTMLQNSFQFPGFNLLQNLSDLTTDKGDAYVKEYYDTKNDSFLKKALSVYKKNDLFLAKIKTEQQLDLSSNLVWRTTARNLYEHAIEACNANANIEDAFYFFEKSRAVLLNDQVNEQRWMADADIAKLATVKKIIYDLDNRLSTTIASSDEYLKIQKELYVKNQQLDVLIDSIKNKNPLYYKSYLDTSFITISQLRKNLLGNSKTLIEIFSGDSAVYVLTITGNNQSLARINKPLYDSFTNSFNSFISNRYILNERFNDFVKTSHQLYKLLFPDIIPTDGSIIISPDGTNYPFEALVVDNKSSAPDYFLNHYATSYTYSVKYLTNQFAVNTGNTNSVLGIAPVQYKNFLNLSALPGSDESLKKINSYFSNATNYALDKATKDNFFKSFPGYSIVQLYTHASDSSSNNDPVIYFSDSALYLSGLLPDRKPITQLVILSACETANGKFYQGEGIFSFNRGFAALGIPAAISNLWSIDNESTYFITELFYKYLSTGLPTDIALQKAKLEFIKNNSSEKKLPYFWAGSILTGKVGIIKSEPGFPWIKLTGAIILFFAIVYFTRKVFLHKKRA